MKPSSKSLRETETETGKRKYKKRAVSLCQMRFLEMIDQLYRETSWFPSQRMTGRALGCTSAATSVAYVSKLEKAGLVEWNRRAGIRLSELGKVQLEIYKASKV